ncbi:hypothetical protein F4821DRAFT_171304 [Hypoxylon rubiginosum]|uniref:Uncharacterized protein n=1 Tax=Hypoxylon rubiginosum TaxID=110542 RepID=A0ACC0CVQ3_9PEZI|nr:hypothetical protein F4821DRAFT_171304 [Hypoxylon rubiginosum]
MKKASSSKGDTSTGITTNAEEQYPAPILIGDIIADFFSLQRRFDSVYICLDGLEECDDLVALFELIEGLIAPSPPFGLAAATSSLPRLVISARPQIAKSGIAADIGCKDMIADLEQHNTPDIRCYLEASLTDVIGEKALQEHVRLVAERSRGK